MIATEKILKATTADKDYFSSHPNEPYYFRDPFPGEWQGFYLLSPLHRLVLTVLDQVMSDLEGKMELKILALDVARANGEKTVIKWPTFHHESDGYFVLMPEVEDTSINFSQVCPAVLRDRLQDMFSSVRPEELEQSARAQCYQNESCGRCDRVFHDGDITFSLLENPIQPICATCKTDEDEVIAIGMCLKANLVRTEEEEKVIEANLVKVTEMMREINERGEIELQ